jgi:Cu(I)/Ag(I) efflux system membrane fusion protein
MKTNMWIVTAIVLMAGILYAAEMSDFDLKMSKITEYYLVIQNDLTEDKTDNVKEMAMKMQEEIKKLNMRKGEELMIAEFKGLPEELDMQTLKLMKAADIKEMREVFKELSKPMARWATMNKPAEINVAYCPMAPGSWLQKGEEIRNPYYGASMLKCGEIVSSGEEKMMKHDCSNCEQNCLHHEMKSAEKPEHHQGKM